MTQCRTATQRREPRRARHTTRENRPKSGTLSLVACVPTAISVSLLGQQQRSRACLKAACRGGPRGGQPPSAVVTRWSSTHSTGSSAIQSLPGPARAPHKLEPSARLPATPRTFAPPPCHTPVRCSPPQRALKWRQTGTLCARCGERSRRQLPSNRRRIVSPADTPRQHSNVLLFERFEQGGKIGLG